MNCLLCPLRVQCKLPSCRAKRLYMLHPPPQRLEDAAAPRTFCCKERSPATLQTVRCHPPQLWSANRCGLAHVTQRALKSWEDLCSSCGCQPCQGIPRDWASWPLLVDEERVEAHCRPCMFLLCKSLQSLDCNAVTPGVGFRRPSLHSISHWPYLMQGPAGCHVEILELPAMCQ